MHTTRTAALAFSLWLIACLGAAAQNLEGLPDTLEFRTELAEGRYACRDGDDWTNQFEITGPSSYAFLGSEVQPGEFDYRAAESTIRFLTGPFSSTPQDTTLVTGYNTTRKQDSIPVILIHFEDPAYGASTEYCARLTD